MTPEIPLKEVSLTVNYGKIDITPKDRKDFLKIALQNQFPKAFESAKSPVYGFTSLDDEDTFLITTEGAEIRSTRGSSFSRVKDAWSPALQSLFDVFDIKELNNVSLAYLNEIPLHDVESFRNSLNISFEMPATLKDRFGFFRSEFTYHYDFGEVRVWLQPDWSDRYEAHCIQMTLESRSARKTPASVVSHLLQTMHEGLKEVFREIVAEQFVRQLPQ